MINRYHNPHFSLLRFFVSIFIIVMFIISVPLQVSATRTIQIDKEIDINPDPRYNWDQTVNYADPNATTTWDEWQNFTNQSGAKGSFVGSLSPESIIDLNRHFIDDSTTSNWTEYTNDLENHLFWQISGSVFRAYTGADVFAGNRYSVQVPKNFNFSLVKTIETDVKFGTVATSYDTVGLAFDLNKNTGSGYRYVLMYHNAATAVLGCYGYSSWMTAVSILFTKTVPIMSNAWYNLRVDFNDNLTYAWFYYDDVLVGEETVSFNASHTVGLHIESTGTGTKANSIIYFKDFGAYYDPYFMAMVMKFSANDIMSGASKWWMRTPIVINDTNFSYLNITLKVYHVQNARIVNFTIDNVTRTYQPNVVTHPTLIANEKYDFMHPNTNTTLTENGHYLVENRTYIELKAPIFPSSDTGYVFCFMVNASVPVNISLSPADIGRDDIFLSFVDDGLDTDIDFMIQADLGISFLFEEGMRDGVTGENFNFTMDYNKVISLQDGGYYNYQAYGNHTNVVYDEYLTTIDKKSWDKVKADKVRSNPVVFNGNIYYTEYDAFGNLKLCKYNLTVGAMIYENLVDTVAGNIEDPIIDYHNDYIIVYHGNKVDGYSESGVSQWTYTSGLATGFRARGAYIYYSGEDYYCINQDNRIICIDTANGNERWHTTLTTTIAFVPALNYTFASPAVTFGGKIYTTHLVMPANSLDFRSIADELNLATGVILNHNEGIWYASTYSTPVVDNNNNVYVSFTRASLGTTQSDYQLIKFSSSLSQTWNKIGYYGPMAHYVNSIYICNVIDPGTIENNGTTDPLLGAIYYPADSLIRIEDDGGEIIWSYHIGDILSSPVIVGGKVYVGCGDGFIYILDTFGKNLTRPILDSDRDGMQDWWELKYGLDPTVSNWNVDSDSDGIKDYYEYLQGTSPISVSSTVDFYMIYNLEPNFIKKLAIDPDGARIWNPAIVSDEVLNGITSFPDNSIRRMAVVTNVSLEMWVDDFYDYAFTDHKIQFDSKLKVMLNDFEHNYLTIMLPFVLYGNATGITPLVKINCTSINSMNHWSFELVDEIKEYVLDYIPIPPNGFGIDEFMVNLTFGFGISTYNLNKELYFNYSSFIQGRVPVYGDMNNRDWFKIYNSTGNRTVWFDYYSSIQGTYGAWVNLMPTTYAIYRTNLPATMVSQVHLAGVPIHIITVSSYTDAQGRTFTTADANQIYMLDDYNLFSATANDDLYRFSIMGFFAFIANVLWDALVHAFGPLWWLICKFALAVGGFIYKIIQWIVEAIQFMANLILQIIIGAVSILLFIAVVWILWRFFKMMRMMAKTIDIQQATAWVQEQADFNNKILTYITMFVMIVFSILGWIIGLVR